MNRTLTLPELLVAVATLSTLMATTLLTGCTAMVRAEPAAVVGDSPVLASERALIRTAWMRIEVEDAGVGADHATEIAEQAGGHVLSSSVQGDRRVTLTLRVPEDRLDDVLGAFSGLGEVRERRVSSEDVSEQLIDTEARLQNLTMARDRLREHLGRADTVQDIIAVEQELARVQSEIDSLQGRLTHLRSRAALSTIELTVERRVVLGPLGYVGWALWWAASKLFVLQ